MKVMLDTNVYDLLDLDTSTLEHVKRLVSDGKITILTTYVQRRELEQIPDPAKRARLLAIPTQEVHPRVALLGVGRIGEIECGSAGANGVRFDVIEQGNPKHTGDALIGVAAGRADVLVTNDKTLKKRVEFQATKLKVWSYEDFKAFIESQP